MDTTNKKGIRWLIFKWFGPQEVQNLVSYIDTLIDSSPQSNGDILIYPFGEFLFNVKTSNEDDLEPIIFPTSQERNAFQMGLTYGVDIMGGTTAAITQEDFETMKEMKKSSTGTGNKKIH